MKWAGPDKDVEPLARGWRKCASGGDDITAGCACKRANHRSVDGSGDLHDRLRIARRGRGEAGFDHVDAQRLERLRHAQLALRSHGEARRLLSVAQGRVKDSDLGHDCGPVPWVAKETWFTSTSLPSCWATTSARRPGSRGSRSRRSDAPLSCSRIVTPRTTKPRRSTNPSTRTTAPSAGVKSIASR